MIEASGKGLVRVEGNDVALAIVLVSERPGRPLLDVERRRHRRSRADPHQADARRYSETRCNRCRSPEMVSPFVIAGETAARPDVRRAIMPEPAAPAIAISTCVCAVILSDGLIPRPEHVSPSGSRQTPVIPPWSSRVPRTPRREDVRGARLARNPSS